MMQTKVYDFNMERVKGRLRQALKENRNELAAADLEARTGLPKYQVEQGIKVLTDECRGQLRVTESGELLYYFPEGLRSQLRGFGPAARRFLRSAARVVARAATALFKVWIVVMLVGYFVLFLGLTLLAVLASFAASVAGRGQRRGGGGGLFSFFLTVRVVELFIWLWLYSGTSRPKQSRGRPLHKSVFAYVFGEGDPNRDYEERQRQYVLGFIRSRKGVITAEEYMGLTGKGYEEAQIDLNRYMLEFEGEPEVTEQGSLIYRFPELLRTRTASLERGAQVPLLDGVRKRLLRFNDNPVKTNRWISFFNGFNLLFGTYFLYFSAANPRPLFDVVNGVARLHVDFSYLFHFVQGLLLNIGAQAPLGIILVGLGIVPVCFAFLFYLIPLLRSRRNRRLNEEARQQNLRRRIVARLLESPGAMQADNVIPVEEDEKPREPAAFVEAELSTLAARLSGEVQQGTGGQWVYSFPEVAREVQDVARYRAAVDLGRYDVGKTVFDSGEEG
jgi:hypothetical protein